MPPESGEFRGEARTEALRVGFHGLVKLGLDGDAVTSDAGLIANR